MSAYKATTPAVNCTFTWDAASKFYVSDCSDASTGITVSGFDTLSFNNGATTLFIADSVM